MIKKFQVVFMEEAREFLMELDEADRNKVIYNIDKSSYLNERELFKKLKDEIWEFRTLYKKKAYRIFAFWDTTDKISTLVIATHGIIKKTNRTPEKEIERAEQQRKKYFKQKNK